MKRKIKYERKILVKNNLFLYIINGSEFQMLEELFWEFVLYKVNLNMVIVYN